MLVGSAEGDGMKPDKDRVKDLLRNWRYWARDCPPDSAEIHYYTLSPMFRQYVKPTPTWARYDELAAEMVEDVLREMFKAYPKDREMLRLYWLYINNQRHLAEALGTSQPTVSRRLAYAENTFAHFWGVLFMGN
jgi:DNA-directed RNA polymerase specialized sigma24 family protein